MNAWPGTGGTHKVSYERPFFTRSIFPVTMLGVAPIPRRPPGSRRARWEPAHNHTHWRCQPHRWALLLSDPKHLPPCPSGPAIGQAHELVEKFVRHFYYLAFNEVTFLNFITQGCTRGFVDSSPDGADGSGKDAVFPERRNFTQGAAGDALGRGHPTGWTPTPPASTCTSPHSWKIRIPTVSCT